MEDPDPDPQPKLVCREGKRKELSAVERQNIVTCLLWELKESGINAKFAGRGVLMAVAQEFHVTHHTLRRV